MRKMLKLVLMCTPLVLPILTASPAAAMRTSYYNCCNPETASGFPFSAGNPHIAAHRTLKFGTKIHLAYKGKELCVTVRDRGPFTKKNGRFTRDLDVTEAAANRLGFKRSGVVNLSAKVGGC